jgi:hypothetical protein
LLLSPLLYAWRRGGTDLESRGKLNKKVKLLQNVLNDVEQAALDSKDLDPLVSDIVLKPIRDNRKAIQ